MPMLFGGNFSEVELVVATGSETDYHKANQIQGELSTGSRTNHHQANQFQSELPTGSGTNKRQGNQFQAKLNFTAKLQWRIVREH